MDVIFLPFCDCLGLMLAVIVPHTVVVLISQMGLISDDECSIRLNPWSPGSIVYRPENG